MREGIRAVADLPSNMCAVFIARTQRRPEPAGDLRALRAEFNAAVKASGPSHLTAVSGETSQMGAARHAQLTLDSL
jgi:hypothetical protein